MLPLYIRYIRRVNIVLRDLHVKFRPEAGKLFPLAQPKQPNNEQNKFHGTE